MGCVNSKTDINDLHPNIFQVMNLDDSCNPLEPGQLEVNEMDLVFYQKGKEPRKWPIKSLRRYGFDLQIFTFECGRRCPSGPGIFAFKCSRAEQIFNSLQTQLQNILDAVPNSTEVINRETEENYLEPAPVHLRQNGNWFSIHNTRLGSVGSSSNGPLSPMAVPPSPLPLLPSSNNNFTGLVSNEDKHTVSHSYSNTSHFSELCSPSKPSPLPPLTLATYANMGIISVPVLPNSIIQSQCVDELTNENEFSEGDLLSPVYMNVIPGKEIVAVPRDLPPKPCKTEFDLEDRHCYANLELSELECLRGKDRNLPTFQVQSSTLSQKINYILLDLDKTSSSSSLAGLPGQLISPVTLTSNSSLSPESPNKPSESYATIDFNRTVALSSVTCPSLQEEEGSRKTRHNSTISDIAVAEGKEIRRTRHNSTISELMAPLTSRLSSSLSD